MKKWNNYICSLHTDMNNSFHHITMIKLHYSYYKIIRYRYITHGQIYIALYIFILVGSKVSVLTLYLVI